MFEYCTVIRLHDTDAAGVLFFANQFKLVHEAYESFLDSQGLGLGKLLAEESYALPLVHARADFKAPLRLGDKVVIKLGIKRKGTTSFTLAHELFKDGSICVGSGETVHISIDRETGKKIPLPTALSKTLTSLHHQHAAGPA